MTCANGHALRAGTTTCPTCGAPAVRRCANGHPLAPGFQLCSACGAFAATPSLATTSERPAADNTWVYLGCGLAVLVALMVVGVLVLRAPTTTTASAPATTKPAPTTARPTTSRPTTSRPVTTAPRPVPGGGFPVTPDQLKAQLKSGGMPPAQADCIVDGLVEEGIDLSTFTAPTDEQQRILVEIARRCSGGG